jgi:hypothetical protein
MKKCLHILLFLSCILFCGSCMKKGEPVVEAKYGTYKFTTYTVDTFRFRVILNGEVLTDSLLTPQSSFTKQVAFFDAKGLLRIIDAKTGQPIIDSSIQLKTGTTSIAIVQFAGGEKPFIPLLPNEGLPAANAYKIRFQYVPPINPLVPYFDSVKCFVRLQDASVPGGFRILDSVILQKGGLTKYYEAAANLRFRIRLANPLTNAQITSPNAPVLNLDNPPAAFNTAIIRGTGTTSSSSQGPYLYEARRVY